MALINCPECNREISDKVKSCPHCGYPIEEETAQAGEAIPQQVEVAGAKTSNKRHFKITLFIILGLALAVAAYFGIKMRNERIAELEYKKTFNDYVIKLHDVKYAMLVGADEADRLCDLTAAVWHNAIFRRFDTATDKYTRKTTSTGYKIWVDDFNEAIENLYNDSGTRATVESIKSNQELVDSLMRELQNPPEGLEKCHDLACTGPVFSL